MAVGRITGPLLKANLLRDGVDLAFETDLLYLDVINGRVGIKTTSPQYDLDINGTARTTNLEVTTQADIATFTISGNTISSTDPTINLSPSGANPVVYQGTIVTGDLSLNTNVIATTGINTDLELTPTGTGRVNINSNALINGNLHVTGNITADGDLTLGDTNTDNIIFAGEVNSDILPSTDNTYNLGSSALRWANLYANEVNINTANVTNFYVTDFQTTGIDITGNTITSIASNSNIVFNTSGTGGVVLGNFKFLNNTMTNIVSNSISNFSETGTGYVKIAGTNGVVIPSGNGTTDRPSAFELGMIRFNTDVQLVEVFNGTGWASVAGLNSGVTFSDATDIGIAVVLMLG